jgi:hypothetical protein
MPSPTARSRAFLLVDSLLVAITLAATGGILLAGLESANQAAARRLAIDQAFELYDAFDLFEQRTGGFPAASGPTGFRLDSFDPLRRRGYYDGPLAQWLAGGRADAYDSPDDRGIDQEFWLEMTLAGGPETRLVIGRTNDAPSGGGDWLDGVYLLERGRLSEVRR